MLEIGEQFEYISAVLFFIFFVIFFGRGFNVSFLVFFCFIKPGGNNVNFFGNNFFFKASSLLRKSEVPKSVKHSLLYDGTFLFFLWISFSRLFFQDIHQDLS